MTRPFIPHGTDPLLTRRTLLQLGACLTLPGGAAMAQTRVTRLVVPYTPGASNDIVARLFADAMARRTGNTWIVENKPGAGSMLGTEFVAKATPDGSTLLLCSAANMGVLPATRKTIRYNVPQDFTFLARVASSPYALTVRSSVPAANFAEFVKLAKARPGGIRVGASGIGALDYMGASMLNAELGIDLQIVPYKGMAGVLNDLRAGQIEAAIVSPGTIEPLAKEGHVRVLTVLDDRRSAVLPEVPSSVDIGQPRLKVVNWWGIAGPARMPAATADALRQDMAAVLANPAFTRSIDDKGYDPAALVGEPFTRHVASDLAVWKGVASQARISIDE
ncbi:Bug family tripartite tricarboxylate transporter substrate binding protein [Hydrogenophaga sp. BPS33]|uniref:Bug family tripartite tricarboxylate transporter substrate binding protein n=1 Tax=Hydrogenophaga sp. BPS33 TaxID=2651974 RepID=UPI00131FE1A0|nr:tripartite tricarboxylate transporter substrate binding protein [Hydrogenophaga sp. BPS33]QHE88049.1 tripartite tricarboxylate transporter substrate binding protein [Hydrogenophaga sp. BPS33]